MISFEVNLYNATTKKMQCGRKDANSYNAGPEWQAGSLGWRSSEPLAACPLEGLVRQSYMRSGGRWEPFRSAR